jgi:alpha-galactosidase/6-phospho-beta-glucosidase family protein
MTKLEELLSMWTSDANIDRTEPGKELINIPKLHAKYLKILSHHRMLIKEYEMKYAKMRKLKWEYYTGKMDEDTLKKYNWEPFQFTLKSEIQTYLESDDDLQKIEANRKINEEIVEVCTAILKELNSRTFQLRDFISWEKFIQGV